MNKEKLQKLIDTPLPPIGPITKQTIFLWNRRYGKTTAFKEYEERRKKALETPLP